MAINNTPAMIFAEIILYKPGSLKPTGLCLG